MGFFDRAREKAALARQQEAEKARAIQRQLAANARAVEEHEAANARAIQEQEAKKAKAIQGPILRAQAEYAKLRTKRNERMRFWDPWGRAQWKSLTKGLRGDYTKEKASANLYAAEQRIKLLARPEPEPELVEYARVPLRPADPVAVLAEMRRQFEADRLAYREREKTRREELKHAKTVYKTLCKQARRVIWESRGVTLDSDIAEIDDIEEQVCEQNAKIERQVHELSNLLAEGLETVPTIDSTREHRPDVAINGSDVILGVEGALAKMQLGIDSVRRARVAYTPDSRQAVIEYELPDVCVVPKAKAYRYVKKLDEITETARPQTQVKSLYAGAIAQLTLLCLATAFASDDQDAIDVAVFNGIVDTLDPRSGQPIRPCLITVRVTRDTFAGINLQHVDPVACLKHLSAGISKSPTELAPVRPVLEFSMVDPRFVAATDAISTLDNRPNLMELSWTEFEVLIQNLFEKMGLEARQTRASRDGGVDCVAYDTRPILGGKIVIQAKRYKNTVGVSAVRDLFGTLQNEGASKGILVTTSGYGPASFEFAQNKPIELIAGAQLLYLLETHADITARIEPPDDWHDPEFDAGEI